MARKTQRTSDATLRRRMECTDAELRDHIKLACERAHRAIGLTTQLVPSPVDQHAIVLHVIAFLVTQAAACIEHQKGRDSVAFTMENIALLLKDFKDAAR